MSKINNSARKSKHILELIHVEIHHPARHAHMYFDSVSSVRSFYAIQSSFLHAFVGCVLKLLNDWTCSSLTRTLYDPAGYRLVSLNIVQILEEKVVCQCYDLLLSFFQAISSFPVGRQVSDNRGKTDQVEIGSNRTHCQNAKEIPRKAEHLAGSLSVFLAESI